MKIPHFSLFVDCDPTTFENVVKEEKWRKAMDDMILLKEITLGS